MGKNQKLKDMEKSIRKYSDEIFIDTIYNKKLNKELLITISESSSTKVKIFEETRGLNEIASISYSPWGGRIFLSAFCVDSNFQRNGIGRFLFDFMLAHGDTLGANYMFGYSMPTDDINGIDGIGIERYHDEQKTLQMIYEKFGCSFDSPLNLEEEDKMFEQKWENGEKYSKATTEIKKLIQKYNKKEIERN